MAESTLHGLKVKDENPRDFSNMCRICLSFDRKLTHIGNLATMFYKFSSINQCNLRSNVLVCWECRAELRRFEHFQDKVRNAESIMQSAIAAEKIPLTKSFSTLTMRIITENEHTYMTYNENGNIHIVAKKEPLDNYEDDSTEVYLPLEHSAEIDFNNDVKDEINAEIDIQLANETRKSKRKSLCAEKNTKLYKNAKAKLKVIAGVTNDVKRDEYYSKVPISAQELKVLLEKERQERQYRCDLCILAYYSEKDLLKHMDKDHGKEKSEFTCSICKSVGASPFCCSIHQHKYECRLCCHTCTSVPDMSLHLRTSHKKAYQCSQCGLCFWRRKEFYVHYKTSHESFICDDCGRHFKMKQALERHIRKKHSPLSCVVCERKFARYSSLWLHKKVKHPASTPERSYCVECNKHFENIYCYKWHLNNSVKHKPQKKHSIPCPGCDKVFTKNIYMKDHYDLVHLNKHKYRCDNCDKNFVRKADLNKHMRRVHEGIKAPKNKICYMCGRGFSSNKILNNHIRTHTGERPFQCEYCTAKFTQKVALVGHVRNIHLKQKKQTNAQSTLAYY